MAGRSLIVAACVAIALAGCGNSSKSLTTPSTAVVPSGWALHTFANVSISAPTSWIVYDQESKPSCVNETMGNTLQLGLASGLDCPFFSEPGSGPNVHITLTRQPKAPVLTTIMGMTMTHEPVGGHAAQRLHNASTTEDGQSIYVPDLNLEIELQQPTGSPLGEQILQTITSTK